MLLIYDFFCEQSTRYDTITELLNRQAYENELTQMEQKGRVAIIMFDVDNFKYVNDNYGHAFGDYCLSKLAEIISDVFSPTGNC
jgi:diguanylate cyclase (GGDEF)-like protein